MKLAPGADRVLAVRKNGARPAEGVVLSLVGPLPVEWLVTPDLDTEYDWIVMVDLDVWIVADSGTEQTRLRRLISALLKHRPRNLRLWMQDSRKGFDLDHFPDASTIHLPLDRWKWSVDAAPWTQYENAVIASVFSAQPEGSL